MLCSGKFVSVCACLKQRRKRARFNGLLSVTYNILQTYTEMLACLKTNPWKNVHFAMEKMSAAAWL